MDKYLIKYFRDNSKNELSYKYIDFFKIVFDRQIYRNDGFPYQNNNRESKLSQRIKLFKQYFNALLNKPSNIRGKYNILSTIEFPINNSLSDLGFESYSPIWNAIGTTNIIGDIKTILWNRKVNIELVIGDFQTLLNSEFHDELEKFQNHLVNSYLDTEIKALFVRSDQYFYSKYCIDVFKKMNKPSFIFSHGLPAVYTLDADNTSDYLMVWSEKIKQNYIKVGFDSSKIKVVGHPSYRNLPERQDLRSGLTDVLVVPVSSFNTHQNEYDNVVLTDRSAVVLYLYKVQEILTKIGVRKARFRVHPSVSREWVYNCLDKDFYTCDTEDLSVSLKKASLVIGCTSTVVLESLIYGVNYIVYEPLDENGLGMLNTKLVPPFDGSEDKIVVANNDEQLEVALKTNAKTDYTLIHDYIQDFDISVLKDLIK